MAESLKLWSGTKLLCWVAGKQLVVPSFKRSSSGLALASVGVALCGWADGSPSPQSPCGQSLWELCLGDLGCKLGESDFLKGTLTLIHQVMDCFAQDSNIGSQLWAFATRRRDPSMTGGFRFVIGIPPVIIHIIHFSGIFHEIKPPAIGVPLF